MPSLTFRKKAILAGLLFVTVGLVVLWSLSPSHERNWEFGQEQLPVFRTEGNTLIVEHFRNFAWTGELTAESRYETRRFDLAQLSDLDVFISHFDDLEGIAHIFLSFGFSDGGHLVISLESRREVGETFSPFRGLFRQYEIIYVVGSEADIVGARTKWRGERVYRYPTVATPEQSRLLLDRLVEDINGIAATPKFYNTLTNNCTNELTRRVEDMSTVQFPLTWKTLLPGYFDEVLYEMGLIKSAGSFAETKRVHLIDNTLADPREPSFSQHLRNAEGS